MGRDLSADDRRQAHVGKAEGGYHEVSVRFPVDREQKLGFTFVADKDQINERLFPYTWYKRLVVAGARARLPDGLYCGD